MPAIDFNTQMVVGVFLGSKPSAGYDVEVVGVRSEGDALVVEYVQKQPGRGTMAAQILTEPYHFVAVAKHPGPIRFLQVPDTEALTSLYFICLQPRRLNRPIGVLELVTEAVRRWSCPAPSATRSVMVATSPGWSGARSLWRSPVPCRGCPALSYQNSVIVNPDDGPRRQVLYLEGRDNGRCRRSLADCM